MVARASAQISPTKSQGAPPHKAQVEMFMQNHFSVNRASEALERTRRTVKRALRNTPADSFEGGHPRWRLPVIIQALESSGAPMTQPRHGGNVGDLTEQCDALFTQFDTAFDRLKALPTLPARREAAIKLYPAIEQMMSAMRARDRADGLNEDYVSLRADRVFNLMLIGLEGPCEWTRGEVWTKLIPADDGD